MSSATELTINSLMVQYLQDEGINITAELSDTSGSTRSQIDFQIFEDGEYNGEGEWQSSYIDGYDQAIAYGELPGAKGYFLIGYPDELANEVQQQRLSKTEPQELLSGVKYRGMFKTRRMDRPNQFQGELEKIPEWIRDSINNRAREDPDEYINLMRDIVSDLTNYIPDAEDYPSIFEHIIGDMPQEENEYAAAQEAAAYLLLNQIAFYRILQGQGYDELDRDDIDKPEDLRNKYFADVLEEDYEAIFDIDVLSYIPNEATQYIRDIIKYINELRPDQFTTDFLGNAFHNIIPLEIRKPVGAYYTNPIAARLLSKITINEADASVADFACGSGTLLMAAYSRKNELIRGGMTEEVHRDFVEEELTGVDIMPFAAHLAAVQLGLRNPSYYTDKPRIAIRDSTTLEPGTTIKALQQSLPSGQSEITDGWGDDDIEDRKIDSGAVSSAGGGTEFDIEKVDAILMNPPFTRKQYITSEYRSELRRRLSEYSEYIDEGMGFYCYFVLLADRFLKTNGRCGFVIPSVILQQQSTEGIRKLLQQNYNLEHIILTEYRSAYSEDTSVSEILLVATKTDDESAETPVRVSSLNVFPDKENLEDLTAQLDPDQETDFSENEIRTVEVPQSEFDDSLDWMSIVREHFGFYYDYPDKERFTSFESQIDGIIGGIRYHAKSNKVHPEDTLLSKDRNAKVSADWKIQNESDDTITAQSQHTAVTLDFPKEVLEPATRSISGIQTIEINEPYDYIVIDRFSDDDQFWRSSTPSNTVSSRSKHVDKRRSQLVLGGYGNLDLTAPGTSLLAITAQNIVPTWSLWAVQTPSIDRARLLCLWWNSSFSIAKLLTERNEVRGSVVKWRQSDLKELPVPNMGALDNGEREELLELYHEIADAEFPALTEQFENEFEMRVKLDKTWARILGWEYYENEDQLSTFYDQISDFLEQMKERMGHD